MTITYQFESVDQIDQNFVNSLKAAFKGKKLMLNIEVEAIEPLTPKIEAAIQYVENGGELVHFENFEALEKLVSEKVNDLEA